MSLPVSQRNFCSLAGFSLLCLEEYSDNGLLAGNLLVIFLSFVVDVGMEDLHLKLLCVKDC